MGTAARRHMAHALLLARYGPSEFARMMEEVARSRDAVQEFLKINERYIAATLNMNTFRKGEFARFLQGIDDVFYATEHSNTFDGHIFGPFAGSDIYTTTSVRQVPRSRSSAVLFDLQTYFADGATTPHMAQMGTLYASGESTAWLTLLFYHHPPENTDAVLANPLFGSGRDPALQIGIAPDSGAITLCNERLKSNMTLHPLGAMHLGNGTSDADLQVYGSVDMAIDL